MRTVASGKSLSSTVTSAEPEPPTVYPAPADIVALMVACSSQSESLRVRTETSFVSSVGANVSVAASRSPASATSPFCSRVTVTVMFIVGIAPLRVTTKVAAVPSVTGEVWAAMVNVVGVCAARGGGAKGAGPVASRAAPATARASSPRRTPPAPMPFLLACTAKPMNGDAASRGAARIGEPGGSSCDTRKISQEIARLFTRVRHRCVMEAAGKLVGSRSGRMALRARHRLPHARQGNQLTGGRRPDVSEVCRRASPNAPAPRPPGTAALPSL